MNILNVFDQVLRFRVEPYVNDCQDCFGSAFSAITAAWATKGYWMQAEIIHYLGDTGLGIYASLIYIIAVGAGLIGYMLGNPPRNYLWYFFGPALFNILVFTTVPAGGVNWQVGVLPDSTPDWGDQREVWKLAEVGLQNQNIRTRLGMQVFSDQAPTGGPNGGKVEVAHLFLWTDDLISDFVQNLVAILGPNYLSDNTAGNTNINEIGRDVEVPTVDFQRISSMKWNLLQNITGANIKTPIMAKALGVFLGSECGDALTEFIDESAFSAAARSRTGQLPKTVFKSPDGEPNYTELQDRMKALWIALPDSLKAMYKPYTAGSNKNSLSDFTDLSREAADYVNDVTLNKGGISCLKFMNYIVEAMRFESANAYSQLIDQAPASIPVDGVQYALFYGWGVQDKDGTLLPANELDLFTIDLMLVHIVKNLFEYTPVSPDQRYTPSEEVESYIKLQQKTTSSTTKFAEVYSWALMIPYIQGLVLYFLSVAYPIVCVAMIMPGLHKMPLTWIKYWFWAKSWDLGFALVQAIERSVWAMMSNGSRSQEAFKKVVEMKEWSTGIGFECFNPVPGYPDQRMCKDPYKVTDDIANTDAFTSYIMPVFDNALALSVNLELDLSNSYYIYIMAALYFAVPAVAGQLVGGAGNIASGALDKMTDVKGAAASGYTSDMNQRMAGFGQSYGQAASFAAQRKTGLGAAAMGAANNQALFQAQSAGYDADTAIKGSANFAAQQVTAHNGAQISAAQGMYTRGKSTVAAMGQAGPGALLGLGANAEGALNFIGSMTGTPDLAQKFGFPAPAAPAGAAPGANRGAQQANAGAQAGGGGGGGGGGGVGAPGAQPTGGPAAVVGQALTGGGILADWTMGSAFDAAQMNNQMQGAETVYGIQHATAMNHAAAMTPKMNAQMSGGQAQRLGAASQFAGASARWDKMNDLNTKMGGKLGVIGLNFSPYSAGQLTDHYDGAAYVGAAGGGTVGANGEMDNAPQSAARFYQNGGGFQSYSNGIIGQVQQTANQFPSSIPNSGLVGTTASHAAQGAGRLEAQGIQMPNMMPGSSMILGAPDPSLKGAAATVAGNNPPNAANSGGNTGFSQMQGVASPVGGGSTIGNAPPVSNTTVK